jgi:hypothetical protein
LIDASRPWIFNQRFCLFLLSRRRREMHEKLGRLTPQLALGPCRTKALYATVLLLDNDKLQRRWSPLIISLGRSRNSDTDSLGLAA